jgi:cyclophilin family peptidyl-prolyl cis-trans isomerase
MNINNILVKLKDNSTLVFFVIVIIIIGCIYYFTENDGKNVENFNNKNQSNNEGENDNTEDNEKHEENDNTENNETSDKDVSFSNADINEFMDTEQVDAEINPQSTSNVYVYLTIAIEDQFKDNILGNVIIKLYNNTPITSKNFLELCRNKKYTDNKIHRVIKDFMIQMGDITNNDGTGGYSIYGEKFSDENFENKHYRSGIVSMANSGPNTNGSQFFITTVEAPHLDEKHVAFGEVVDGMDTVFSVENQITNTKDEPVQKCFIKDCGIYSSI